MSCLSPATFDHVPLAVAHVSLQGAILRVNRCFAEITGVAERDLINQSAAALLTPEVTEDEARALREVVKGELGEFEMRKTLRRGDGAHLPVAVRYSALRDMEGRARCGMIIVDPPGEHGAREELERIARVVSADTGEVFFRNLLTELTRALGTDVAFIAELVEAPARLLRTIAAYDRGQMVPNFGWAVAGSPCDAILEYGHCVFPSAVRQLFPHSENLQALEMEAYVGVRLQGSRQQPIGVLAVLHRQPLASGDRAETMLRIFAPRVTAELERLRAEQELRRSEAYLSEAQRIAHLGNWVWEPEEDTLLGSEETYRICGLGGPPRVLPSREFFNIVHADDREAVRAAFARAAQDLAPLEMAFRIVTPDGTVRMLELRGEFAFALGRRVGRMRGTLQDVTEREMATEDLRKLSMAVEQAADQIVITDAKGTIEYVNRAFETMTGYAAAEAIGQNPRILKSGLQPQAFYRELWQTIERGGVFRGVFINRKKNGEIYYEEKTVTPIRNAKGEIAKYVASGTDITERRMAEEEQARLHEAVRAAAAEWRITFDSMQAAIVVLGADGAIRRVNHAASNLLRARPAELVGARLDRIAAYEPWKTAASLVDALRDRGMIPAVQVPDAAAGVIWEITLASAGVQSGNQVILVIRDITQTVRLQDSLRRSETMSAMGALVAGVAHEARNPLFGISATLDAFEKSLRSGGTDHGRYVGVLRREIDRLNQLMHELLEYGRPLELDLADATMDEIVARALQACQLAAAAGEVVLENAVEPGLTVWCDSHKVEQVVRNLVENAIQHSARGKRVVVRTAVDGRARLAGCQVLDEGAGFDPHDLDQVFEPFFSRRRGGTGLGLSIVQRIVEQHGGRVSATNRAGGGACVRVLLPVSQERS